MEFLKYRLEVIIHFIKKVFKIKDIEDLKKLEDYIQFRNDCLKEKDECKEINIELIIDDFKIKLMQFLGNENIIRAKKSRNNSIFFEKIELLLKDIQGITRSVIYKNKIPKLELFTTETAIERIIEYNRKAKDLKNQDSKKSKEFYDKKAEILVKYGIPVCIHSLKYGKRYALVKIENRTFHCPADLYTFDITENLEVLEYKGIIK